MLMHGCGKPHHLCPILTAIISLVPLIFPQNWNTSQIGPRQEQWDPGSVYVQMNAGLYPRGLNQRLGVLPARRKPRFWFVRFCPTWQWPTGPLSVWCSPVCPNLSEELIIYQCHSLSEWLKPVLLPSFEGMKVLVCLHGFKWAAASEVRVSEPGNVQQYTKQKLFFHLFFGNA